MKAMAVNQQIDYYKIAKARDIYTRLPGIMKDLYAYIQTKYVQGKMKSVYKARNQYKFIWGFTPCIIPTKHKKFHEVFEECFPDTSLIEDSMYLSCLPFDSETRDIMDKIEIVYLEWNILLKQKKKEEAKEKLKILDEMVDVDFSKFIVARLDAIFTFDPLMLQYPDYLEKSQENS